MSEAMQKDENRPSTEFLKSVAEKIAARKRQAPSQTEPRPSAPAAEQPAQPKAAKSGVSGLERAAAVLAWFEPTTLQPVHDATRSPGEDGSVDELLKSCVETADREGKPRMTLSPARRIAALSDLREAGLVQGALALNKRPEDPIQQALDAYLLGQEKPVGEQTLAELAATHQVCGWLRAAGFTSLPAPEDIERRTEWLTLLNPFEHVAGDDKFRGRQEELAEMREYAGVLPPQTIVQAGRRVFDYIFSLKEKPPLLIVGVGGVGKSTLIARFILEHARAQERHRFPFAYLDFDRPEIDAQEPLTLMIEAVRQFGIEYPHARPYCESLRRNWTEGALAARQRVNVQANVAQTREPGNDFGVPEATMIAVRDFASLVGTLGASDQPVLFMLDTFEEVQWRSAGSVEAVWRLLERLQEAVPRLRVVLAGRAEISGKETKLLRLTGLDLEAATAYLQRRGVTDSRVAKRIAQQIGGSPLSLQLAAELYRSEGADRKGELSIETRTSLFFKMDSTLLQRQLYSRVLGHVHDPNVRKLAHPGLVLRRVTADLIFNVLAKPCGITLRTLGEAARLFDALKREVSLVNVAPDGSVQHRRDLRLVMLELLRADNLARVQSIHQAAVGYYEARPEMPLERAEEIYHRLSLDQPLDEISNRWIEGVEPYISTALEEFSGRRRAWLASRLGLDIDAETRLRAVIEDWEIVAERDARQLLAHGEGQRALDVIRARADRRECSPLVELEARALIQVGRSEEALEVDERGFDAAIDAGNRHIALALALQAAEILLASGPHPNGTSVLKRLALLREGTLSTVDEVAVLTRSVALMSGDKQARKAADALRRKLRKAFDSLTDEELHESPTLGFWTVSVCEAEDVERIARVIAVCGLPRGADAELRELAAAFTALDASESRKLAQRPGELAAKLGIPVVSSLTVAWADFLIRAPEHEVEEKIPALMREYAKVLPPQITTSAANLMRAVLGTRRVVPQETVKPNERPKGSPEPQGKHSPQQQGLLAKALGDAFTPREFQEFALYRLNRSVESISFAKDFKTTLDEVVNTAEKQEWFGELLDRALQAKPGNELLISLSEQVLNADSPLEQLAAASFVDPEIFRRGFNQAAARVARLCLGARPVASAFLVGPDLMLTSDAALEEVYESKSHDVSMRVEFTGTVGHLDSFELDEDWLVSRSSRSEKGLGYALLRVSRAPGAQPIGGPRAESAAELRQWFDLNAESAELKVKDQVIVYSATADATRNMRSYYLSTAHVRAIREKDFLEIDANSPGNIVRGAPCFSNKFELVSMILDQEKGKLVAVSIAAIRAHLGSNFGKEMSYTFA